MKKVLSILLIICLFTAILCSCSKNGEGDVPTGMKLASDPEISKGYSLFVPEAWTVDMSTGITSAYVSSVDRSSVSVTYEVPQESTIKEYWDNRVSQFSSVFESFEIIEEGVATKLGNADAASYTYTAEYNGHKYKFMQLFAIRGVYLYTFTYTALNEESVTGKIPFDSNLDYVYKVIENFKFN